MGTIISELFALRGTPWYRWHPQLAIRYWPVVEWIRRFERPDLCVREGPALSILEVGSGGLGIAPYLKQPVTGVDIRFDPPIHQLLTPVLGDVTKLKFPDKSFNIVVSMDMLEHLPKEKRQKAISEMLRIARVAVAIGAPCGTLAAAQDEQLRRAYRTRHGKDFPFLQEQVEYGLPEETDILGYINNARQSFAKRVTISVIGNTNLNLRKFLMRGWMSNNLFVNLLFRKVFLLLVPLFRFLDRPPYYRKIFFVKVSNPNDPNRHPNAPNNGNSDH